MSPLTPPRSFDTALIYSFILLQLKQVEVAVTVFSDGLVYRTDPGVTVWYLCWLQYLVAELYKWLSSDICIHSSYCTLLYFFSSLMQWVSSIINSIYGINVNAMDKMCPCSQTAVEFATRLSICWALSTVVCEQPYFWKPYLVNCSYTAFFGYEVQFKKKKKTAFEAIDNLKVVFLWSMTNMDFGGYSTAAA